MSENAEIRVAIFRGKITGMNNRLKEIDQQLHAFTTTSLSRSNLSRLRIERRKIMDRLTYVQKCERRLVASIAKAKADAVIRQSMAGV